MIPGSITAQFTRLCNRVSELHGDWKTFRFLYGEHPEHFDIFNEIDSDFFALLHSLFYERFCMFLCRLSDPAEQFGGRARNLTLEHLFDLAVQERPHEELRLRDALQQFRERTEVFRHLRDKYYAHWDRERELAGGGSLFSRRDVEQALDALRTYMNLVREIFGESHMGYDYVITPSDGGSVILAMRKAMRYDHLVEEGTIPRHDFFELLPQQPSVGGSVA